MGQLLPLQSGAGSKPTIRRFTNRKIAIYADDHRPPHFHIEGRGFRAIVEISAMAVLAGSARSAREAMAWASTHRALLEAEWRRLNERDGQ